MSDALALLEGHGGAPALTDAARALTRDELAARSARVAAGLHERGVGAGDRVALWLPNVPDWLVLFFACVRLGAIAVSVNTRFRAHEVGDILGRADCRVLAYAPGFRAIDFAGILADVPPGALRALESVVLCGEDARSAPGAPGRAAAVLLDELDDAPPDGLPAPGGAGDRCVIFTTSGTTRAPKFVCHDQRSVTDHARDVACGLGLDRGKSRILQALPLCGVFGFTQAMAALAAGCPMHLMPVFDAAEAASLVIERGITHMNGVDDMIDRMLAVRSEPRPFPTLAHFGYARFNPALEDIVERAAARGVCMRGLYGMSECQALFAVQPAALPDAERRKGGGRPLSPAAQVRVRDPVGGGLLGPGERGEIELAGPSLMREYFGDAEATAAAFTDDGFLRTGDLGELEPDGRFHYVARLGDVLRLGGFLTSPGEIEAVLDEHPDVEAAQVVAIELEGRLAPVAFCLAAAGVVPDEEDVIAFCRARLAGYKVPARVFVVDAFPTTASANGTKIQKAKLRALAYDLALDSP